MPDNQKVQGEKVLMENKFIRIISPFSYAMALLFDIFVAAFMVTAFNKIMTEVSTINIAFLIITIISAVIAILTSKEVFSSGVKFNDKQFEFTAIDSNNVFEYSKIEKIESSKDVSASFKKGFVDRYSHIIVYFKNGSITTIELGLTTVKSLNKITNEIKSRIE